MKALDTVAPESMVGNVNAGGRSTNLKDRCPISPRDKGQVFTFPGLTPGRRTPRPHSVRRGPPQWGGFSFASSRAVRNHQEHAAELRKPDSTVFSAFTYGTPAAF